MPVFISEWEVSVLHILFCRGNPDFCGKTKIPEQPNNGYGCLWIKSGRMACYEGSFL